MRFDWSQQTGVRFIFEADGATLSSFSRIGTQATIEAVLTAPPWTGWRLRCKEARVCSVHSGSGLRITLDSSPLMYPCLTAPGYNGPPEESDVMVFWLQNFFFQALIETSKFRRCWKLDGFKVSLADAELIFRQTPDHDKLEKRCSVGAQVAVLASVLELRGPMCAREQEREERIGCLISLMSALEGTWIWPAVVAKYGSDKSLREIVFPDTRAFKTCNTRPAVENDYSGNGWPSIIAGMWPGFVAQAQTLNLRSACRQLVEAQSGLMADSAIAILLMCLEQLTTHFLAARGVVSPDAPLESKLNRCNKELRCIPKAFRNSLPTIRNLLRNRLFHTGQSGESDLDKLYGWELELQNAAVLTLCAMSGYRGPVRIHGIDESKIVTVDHAGLQ